MVTRHVEGGAVLVIACGLTLCATLAGFSQTPAPSLPAPTETLLIERDAGAPLDDKEMDVSAHGDKVAWRTQQAGKWAVMVNADRQAGTYDQVEQLRLSADGAHLAFVAKLGKTAFVVLDGKEAGQRFDDIETLVLSRTGGRIAYTAKRDKKWVTVVGDQVPSTAYDKVESIRFSPNGERVAYFARREGKWSLVLDGQEQPQRFSIAMGGVFSPDSQRFAYAGQRDGKWFMVVDGKEGEPYPVLSGFEFAADSKRFAYGAVTEIKGGFSSDTAKSCLVVDSKPGQVFEGQKVQGSLMRFYFRSLDPDMFGVSAPAAFSRDGARVAYAARRGKEDSVVILEGEPGPSFKSILGGPLFAPDTNRVVYVASDAGHTTLVIDGQKVGKGMADAADYVSVMLFAPDRQRVAFVAVNGGRMYEMGFSARAKRRVYVHGEPGKEYNALGLTQFQFTEDGRHLVYVVRLVEENGKDVSFVVINGTEGKRYDDVLTAWVDPANPTAVTLLAQSGRRLIKVTQPLP